MNQEEDGQDCLYVGLLHPDGKDSFVETNALEFLNNNWVTHNDRLL